MTQNINGVIKGAPTALESNQLFTDSLQLWVKQRNALINDQWKDLEKLAIAGLGDAYASYRQMMRTLGVQDQFSKEATENLSLFLKFHASQKDSRKEFFEEVKNQLLKIKPDTSPARLAAIDALGEGNLSHNLILESFKGREVENTEAVNRAIDSTVALATRSLVALTHANYNLHYKELEEYPFALHEDELIEHFSSNITEFEEGLKSYLKELHSELGKKRSVQTAAEALAAHIEDALPEFGRLQASLYLYIAALKKVNASASTIEKAGRLSLRASSATRSAFSSHASAFYLSLQTKAADKDPKAKQLLDQGDKQFETSFFNGKDTNLAQVPGTASGTYIEVQGFVHALSARRDGDNKLLSTVTLSNLNGTDEVHAVGVFVQLRNIGLQEGAYCKLSGTWQKNSNINGGNPAIEIEQLRLDELGKKSWKDQFEDLSDRFVDRWPGGLNISYGISPHVSGGPEGDSKILGAGELIFKPFYR